MSRENKRILSERSWGVLARFYRVRMSKKSMSGVRNRTNFNFFIIFSFLFVFLSGRMKEAAYSHSPSDGRKYSLSTQGGNAEETNTTQCKLIVAHS